MAIDKKVKYWITSANSDWRVARHLVEKKDYSYALFFGHLTIEKLLKAIFVDRFNETPPYTHRLVYIAERTGIELSEENLELLEAITDFNMEARYPDEKFSFFKKCTHEFTNNYLEKIKELRKWLLNQIQSSKR